jgi:small subunit ribosomal protein S1
MSDNAVPLESALTPSEEDEASVPVPESMAEESATPTPDMEVTEPPAEDEEQTVEALESEQPEAVAEIFEAAEPEEPEQLQPMAEVEAVESGEPEQLEPVAEVAAPVGSEEPEQPEPLTEVAATVEPEELAPVAEVAETPEPEAPAVEETVEAVPEPPAPAAQDAEMQDVFSDEFTYSRPKRGEIRTGTVIEISAEGMLIDLGLKREGLVPGYDLQRVGSEAVESVSEGDELPIYVVRPEHNQEGHVIVSWYRARQEQDWVDAQKLLESGDVWEGEVRGYNRGGLIVPFGKIRGFVPASHVTGIRRRMGQASLQARLAEMVGQMMPLKVLEVNRPKRRLIFSERTARRQWRALQREKLLAELQEGDHVHGTVSNVCDFGAFVDIGGTDGLVHISELSWRRTSHPSEVVSVGDEVDAYVLRVDRDRRRIGLSLRLMEPDPWETVEEKYTVGQLVTGLVTKLTDFGAFAALDDGIEGLIHISELAEVPPRHPSEVVTAGTTLPLIVVKIDSRRRRMGLSLKRVSEEEWFEWEEERRAQAEAEEAEAAAEPEEEAVAEAVAAEEAQLEAELPPAAAVEPGPEAEPAEEPEPQPEPTGEVEAQPEAAVEAGPEAEPAEEPEPQPELAGEVKAQPEAAEEPAGEVEAQPEAAVEPEPQPEPAEEIEAQPEAVVPEPPVELEEPMAAAESGSFEPPDEVLMDEPPPEEMQEPPPTLETTPPEPPDDIPVKAPPPDEEGFA